MIIGYLSHSSVENLGFQSSAPISDNYSRPMQGIIWDSLRGTLFPQSFGLWLTIWVSHHYTHSTLYKRIAGDNLGFLKKHFIPSVL